MNGSLCQRLFIVFYAIAVAAATTSSIEVTIQMQTLARVGCFSTKMQQIRKGSYKVHITESLN